MSAEIYWLALTVLMTGLLWVPYILNRFYEMGVLPAIMNLNTDGRPKALWAQRMMDAHMNAVENLVVFAPLALIVHVAELGNPLTVTAVKVYFFTRLIHFIVYSAGVPAMRTVTFLVGFGCQMILALTILGVL